MTTTISPDAVDEVLAGIDALAHEELREVMREVKPQHLTIGETLGMLALLQPALDRVRAKANPPVRLSIIQNLDDPAGGRR